jgi:lysozyme
MSHEGRKHLIDLEGSRLIAYRDTKGIWTIGIGHSARAGSAPIPHAGMAITREQEHEILARDLAHFEHAVNSSVKVPISQTQFDALVSFAFNIGATAFRRSSVVKRLNEGDHPSAAEAMLLWRNPPEIEGRRRKEYALFKKGIEVA